MPASSQTISRFVTFLASTLKPQSVRAYLAGVRLLYIELGFPNPIDNCWLISSTLKGISHLKDVATVQKIPITPDILRNSTLVPKVGNKHGCSREL